MRGATPILLFCAITIANPPTFHYLRPRIRTLIISTPCQPPLYPFPVLKKDGRSRPSLLLKTCMPSLYHIRTVIHSIHDSFVEIRGGLSYHLRSRHRTAFVILIIPPSSPFSYHFRSAKYFQPPINQPIPKFPSFPNFPNFPRFPRIPAFPCFPHFPCVPFYRNAVGSLTHL